MIGIYITVTCTLIYMHFVCWYIKGEMRDLPAQDLTAFSPTVQDQLRCPAYENHTYTCTLYNIHMLLILYAHVVHICVKLGAHVKYKSDLLSDLFSPSPKRFGWSRFPPPSCLYESNSLARSHCQNYKMHELVAYIYTL